MKSSPAELRKIFHYDPKTGLLWWKNPAPKRRLDRPAGTWSKDGYVRISYNYHLYLAHQIIWAIVKGTWAKEIDHRNTIRSDNRWKNLRSVTRTQNNANLPRLKNNTSGFKGVYFCQNTKRWRARINFHGQTACLGRFDTPEAAHAAYAEAAKKYFGEFARTA